MDESIASDFESHLQTKGIGITSLYGGTRQRWVTHLDVNEKDVNQTLELVGQFFN